MVFDVLNFIIAFTIKLLLFLKNLKEKKSIIFPQYKNVSKISNIIVNLF